MFFGVTNDNGVMSKTSATASTCGAHVCELQPRATATRPYFVEYHDNHRLLLQIRCKTSIFFVIKLIYLTLHLLHSGPKFPRMLSFTYTNTFYTARSQSSFAHHNAR